MNQFLKTSTEKKARDFCIVGGGLVGSMLAGLLAKRGLDVDIFEKRKDIRQTNVDDGRSIAMSLSFRGWHALERIGLKDAIEKIVHPKYGRIVHTQNKECHVQDYGRDMQAISTINRRDLNIALINHAEKSGRVRYHFEHLLDFYDPISKRVSVIDTCEQRQRVRTYAHVIGADGLFSKIRESLFTIPEFTSTVSTLDHGYKEINIHPDSKESWALEPHMVHCWPRQNKMIVALPNIEHAFNSLFLLPLKGEDSIESIKDSRDLKKVFSTQFEELIPLLPNLESDFFKNPSSQIFTVQCAPWNMDDRVLIMGDAAHGIAPFYAMGMNVGFEDCTFFDTLIDQYDMDWKQIFHHFSTERKKETDVIGELSLNNFNQLKHSIDPDFHLKWQLERRLWESLPDKWRPLYARIAFSDESYEISKSTSLLQKRIIDLFSEKEDLETIMSSKRYSGFLEEVKAILNSESSL